MFTCFRFCYWKSTNQIPLCEWEIALWALSRARQLTLFTWAKVESSSSKTTQNQERYNVLSSNTFVKCISHREWLHTLLCINVLGNFISLFLIFMGTWCNCVFQYWTSTLLCITKLQLSEMMHIECWKLCSVPADIAVVIFRVNMYWLGIFWSLK
jgi:hypothetical protein